MVCGEAWLKQVAPGIDGLHCGSAGKLTDSRSDSPAHDWREGVSIKAYVPRACLCPCRPPEGLTCSPSQNLAAGNSSHSAPVREADCCRHSARSRSYPPCPSD